MTFAIEPAVIGLASEVGKFGPTVGAPNGFIGLEDVFGEGEEQLTPAVALLVMIGWVGLAFAAAAARLDAAISSRAQTPRSGSTGRTNRGRNSTVRGRVCGNAP